MTELGTWLEEQLEARRLSQRGLAEYSGISKTVINDIIRRDHIPTAKILVRLAKQLKLDPVILLEKAGYIRPGAWEEIHPDLRSVFLLVAGDMDTEDQGRLAAAWKQNYLLAKDMLQRGQETEREVAQENQQSGE